MKTKRGDLIKAFAKGKVNVLCHCCTRKNTFDSGFAKQLKEAYPESFKADQVWKGERRIQANILIARDVSAVKLSSKSMIVNLYVGEEKLNYGMLAHALSSFAISLSQAKNLNPEIQDWVIGFPINTGCSKPYEWKTTREMIDYIFKAYLVKIYKPSE